MCTARLKCLVEILLFCELHKHSTEFKLSGFWHRPWLWHRLVLWCASKLQTFNIRWQWLSGTTINSYQCIANWRRCYWFMNLHMTWEPVVYLLDSHGTGLVPACDRYAGGLHLFINLRAFVSPLLWLTFSLLLDSFVSGLEVILAVVHLPLRTIDISGSTPHTSVAARA